MSKPDIVGLINQYNTWTPQEVVQAFGSIGKAAAAMAGVPYQRGVSKDKEYKAARRSLERQLSGQYKKPGPGSQEKLNVAGRQAQGKKPIGITFTGTAAVNGRGEDYESERDIDRVYDEDEWDELSAMALEGDEDGIWGLIAEEYHVSSFELVDGEIHIGEE